MKAGRQTGQRLLLVNITANAITLQSDGVVPGTNLFLGAAGRALAVNGILELVWTSAGKWQEVGFLNTAS